MQWISAFKINNEQVVWRTEHHYDVPLTTYNTCPTLGLMILHEWTWTIEQSTIIVPVSHFRFQVFHGPTFWLEYISVPRHDPFNCLGRHLSTISSCRLFGSPASQVRSGSQEGSLWQAGPGRKSDQPGKIGVNCLQARRLNLQYWASCSISLASNLWNWK